MGKALECGKSLSSFEGFEFFDYGCQSGEGGGAGGVAAVVGVRSLLVCSFAFGGHDVLQERTELTEGGVAKIGELALEDFQVFGESPNFS